MKSITLCAFVTIATALLVSSISCQAPTADPAGNAANPMQQGMAMTKNIMQKGIDKYKSMASGGGRKRRSPEEEKTASNDFNPADKFKSMTGRKRRSPEEEEAASSDSNPADKFKSITDQQNRGIPGMDQAKVFGEKIKIAASNPEEVETTTVAHEEPEGASDDANIDVRKKRLIHYNVRETVEEKYTIV
jgi:hypothetical protein